MTKNTEAQTKPSSFLLSSFATNEKGSVIPLVGLSMIALIGLAGIAIDTIRASLVQAKLSSALDAAGLAAGASVNTANITSEATKYLNANFPAGYMNSGNVTLNVTINADNTVIDLSATTTQQTTLMRVLGKPSVTVGATSQITRANKGLELVLALDNTGSMATATSTGTRLSDLKSAATSLVTILYGTKTTVPNLWIGLVPFSQAVNIDSSRTAWMNTAYTSSLDWGPTSWGGCVEARTSGNLDTTDAPPATQLFKAYYFPDDATSNNWISVNSRTGNKSYTINSTHGPNLYCPQAVTPMTAIKATILSGINSMSATGNTHINLGAVWAWRMLSPRWRGLWGGEMNTNSLPLAYNTPLMNKAVILMTDGENTMSAPIYTAYSYLSAGRLGTTNTATAVNQLDSRLTTVCTAMKQQGVIIYTIAFGGDPSTATQNLLRNCATQPDYFFNSPTSAELQTAFRTIGDSLANLRISQ